MEDLYLPFKSHYWRKLSTDKGVDVTELLLPSVEENKAEVGQKEPRPTPAPLVNLLSVPIAKHPKLASHFDGGQFILVTVFEDGTTMAFESDLKSRPKLSAQISVPMILLNDEKAPKIAYVAIDTLTLQLYFTLSDDRVGIFTVNLELLLLNESRRIENVKLFVRGSGNRRFEGLAVDSHSGSLFCCDSKKHRAVRQWSMVDGRELPEIGLSGSAQFAPRNCSVAELPGHRPVRYLAVTEWLNNSVHIFTVCGEEIHFSHTLARFGTKLGQVNGPRNLVFDIASNLFVIDTGNRRIQMFCRKSIAAPPADELTSDSGIVWHFQAEPKEVPLALATLLTSDAYPRPIIVLAIACSPPPPPKPAPRQKKEKLYYQPIPDPLSEKPPPFLPLRLLSYTCGKA